MTAGKSSSLALAIVAPAQAAPKQVGTWFVEVEKDRFSDSDRVVAITGNNTGSILALRCMANGLTFAVMDKAQSLQSGWRFLVSFKGGKHAVRTTLGSALDEHMVEIAVTDDMRADRLTSDEFAFRLAGET